MEDEIFARCPSPEIGCMLTFAGGSVSPVF